ncbi:UDP-N-acetylglucosamine 2-epimerase [Polynucleobacter sp. MG-Unter2-18]|uniref:UDP-N-acetylglucosamine 2-epimerase n=1 Tax=Polynucleobacter sp. MG-Unter2-18 TaxID=2081052 RepID=UPI0021115413|nr:UDP-N-acetylglucosamine 2-epimerase [Polynucleobacter sp. MG-Unter2-18]
MKKICVVTGTRADYGLLRFVMEGIRNASDFQLQIIVTGMHLSPDFGMTAGEIEIDGFYIDQRVEMLMSSDTPVGVSKSMGLGMIGFADAYAHLKPDMVVLLGDRFEIFAAASAALVAHIPIAHLHGGETTEGAFDEAIRHSITKMSHLHFVAADVYRKRVIQLGEDPQRVFTVGGLGVDSLSKVKLLERGTIESELGFKFGRRNLLLTFHPVTLEPGSAGKQMQELLLALDNLKDTHVIFTMPNADPDSRVLFEMVAAYVRDRSHTRVYTSLGQLRYLSVLAQVDAVVGNSSSGLTEAPSFKKGTVNIGDRQRGRLRAASVIDCEPTYASISQALEHLYSTSFQASLPSIVSPYGTAGASDKIVQTLRTYPISGTLKKVFHDLPEVLLGKV